MPIVFTLGNGVIFTSAAREDVFKDTAFEKEIINARMRYKRPVRSWRNTKPSMDIYNNEKHYY